MSAFEFNKFAGAFLGTVILIVVLNLVGNELFAPHEPEQRAIAVSEQAAPAATEAAAETPPLGVLLAAADVEKGKEVAKKCASCHTFAQGGKNKIGPNLWATLGAQRARVEGFKYSSAMAGAGGAWGYDELDAFLANPKAAIKGTKMTYAGVKKATDRVALILYLRTLSDAPPPLPAAN